MWKEVVMISFNVVS